MIIPPNFSMIKFKEEIENGNLENIKNIYSLYPTIDICIMELGIYYACSNNQLEIAKWIYSKYPNMFQKDIDMTIFCFYDNLFIQICYNNNLEIVKWLYSIKNPKFDISRIIKHIFDSITKDIFFSLELKKYFDYKYEKCKFLNLLKYLAEINPNMIDSFIKTFNYSCIWNNIKMAKWLYSLKPYHFTLEIEENKIKNYSIICDKDRKWNSCKTVIFMSQTKNINKNLFRSISDDVVKVMLEYI